MVKDTGFPLENKHFHASPPSIFRFRKCLVELKYFDCLATVGKRVTLKMNLDIHGAKTALLQSFPFGAHMGFSFYTAGEE